MITISFQCTDAAQAREELLKMAAVLSSAPIVSGTVAKSVGEYITQAKETAAQLEFNLDVPEKPKRGRKKKEENNLAEGTKVKVHNDGTDEFESNPEPEIIRQAPGKPTRETVHTALQQVNSACGLPTARTILSEFKAQRISELKEEFFESFIRKCEAAVELQG